MMAISKTTVNYLQTTDVGAASTSAGTGAGEANQSSSAASTVDPVSNFVAMYGLHSLTAAAGTGDAVLQGAHEQKKQTQEISTQAEQANSSAKGSGGGFESFMRAMFGGDNGSGDTDSSNSQ